jgi:hypothetical protein
MFWDVYNVGGASTQTGYGQASQGGAVGPTFLAGLSWGACVVFEAKSHVVWAHRVVALSDVQTTRGARNTVKTQTLDTIAAELYQASHGGLARGAYCLAHRLGYGLRPTQEPGCQVLGGVIRYDARSNDRHALEAQILEAVGCAELQTRGLPHDCAQGRLLMARVAALTARRMVIMAVPPLLPRPSADASARGPLRVRRQPVATRPNGAWTRRPASPGSQQ